MTLTPNAREALQEALARFTEDAADLRRSESDPRGRMPLSVENELEAYTLMCNRLRAILDGRDPGPPATDRRLA
jgi:hypothetical protein